MVLDDLRQPQLYLDPEAWSAAAEKLEREWFAPLFAAIRAGTLGQATLLTDSGKRFILTRRSARRWWRWRKPLTAYT